MFVKHYIYIYIYTYHMFKVKIITLCFHLLRKSHVIDHKVDFKIETSPINEAPDHPTHFR